MRDERTTQKVVIPTHVELAARELGLPVKTVLRLLAAHELRTHLFVNRQSQQVLNAAWHEMTNQLHEQDDPDNTSHESIFHIVSDVDLPRTEFRGFRDAELQGCRGVLLQHLPQRGRMAYRLLLPIDASRAAWTRVKGGGIDGWLVPSAEANQLPRKLMVNWAPWQRFA